MSEIGNGNIGINKGFIFNNDLKAGKEIGKFDSKEKAMEAAKKNKGSELLYNQDDEWGVVEVKEKNLFGLKNDLSVKDKESVEIGDIKLAGLKETVISFIEEDIPGKKNKP